MSTTIGPVEVAETKWEGWGWHCPLCQLTHLRLDGETALRQAQEHAARIHPRYP